MDEPYIVVVGASVGGLRAFSKLVAGLPADFPAAVFFVQHIAPNFKSHLADILSAKGPLTVREALDRAPIIAGTICVARPNYHLLVKDGFVTTPFGPRENRFRPSIDAMFRSAAVFHTTRVIAVLLTGYLDDGVNGLDAVKRCGGVVIVQNPDEAEVPDMPRNAIRHVAVDHVLAMDAITQKLSEIVHRPAAKSVFVPEDLMEKIRISEHRLPGIEKMETIGEVTPYTCPECGGTMWSVKNEPIPRLICHTGHSLTENAFLDGQAEVIENSMWAAIRFMDERIKILKDLAERNRENNLHSEFIFEYEKKIKDLEHHKRILGNFITSGGLAPTMNSDGASSKAGRA